MADARIFPDEEARHKAEDYHGGCRVVRINPDALAEGVESLNIEISFEQALRLSLALQSALVNLNRYNRGTVIGREMGVLLLLDIAGKSVSIMEKRVVPEE
jgi:hypothetical protein